MSHVSRARLVLACALFVVAAVVSAGCTGGGSGWECDGQQTVIPSASFQALTYAPTYSSVETLPTAVEASRITRAQLAYTADNQLPTTSTSIEFVIAPEPRSGVQPTVVDRVVASGFPLSPESRTVDITTALKQVLTGTRSYRLGGRTGSAVTFGDVECRDIRVTVCYDEATP